MKTQKLGRTAAVVVLLCQSLSAWALSDLTSPVSSDEASLPALSGRLFTNVYFPSFGNPASRLVQQNNEAWLGISHRASESLNAKVTLMLRNLERPADLAGSALTNDPRFTETEIREAYARYFQNGVDVQFGKQLISWGKADAINPTDYFSAKDLRLFNQDEEVRRRGPTALLLNFTPDQGASPITFTAVLAPIFAQTRLLIPPRLITTGVTLQDPALPAGRPGDFEEALKVSYAGRGWDASLSGFRGWNHVPNLNQPVMTTSAGGTLLTVSQTFNRQSALGADFSLSFGSYVFRGEGAARFTENMDGLNPKISPPQQEIVIGVERPLGDRFRAQLQGTFRHISQHAQWVRSLSSLTAVDLAAAQANSILQGYQFPNVPGATARLTYASSDEDWRSEIFILSSFSSSSPFESDTREKAQYLIRPKVTREWIPGFQTTLGLDHFIGSSGTLFGASQDYRSIFIEALYGF